jgi:hypothetical protein
MKQFFRFLGSLILIYLVYLAFEWMWKSGIVGKIFVILFLILGLWNATRNVSDGSPLLKNHKVSYPNYIHLVE